MTLFIHVLTQKIMGLDVRRDFVLLLTYYIRG